MLAFIKRNLYVLIMMAILTIIFIITLLFFTIPRVEYKYSNEYEGYKVSLVFGSNTKYSIAEAKKGKAVTAIGTRAFYQKPIKTIDIKKPENINTIEKLAFFKCKNLEEIDISNVKNFERNAFQYCKKLKLKELNCINIGASAFYGCESITELKLNEGLETIGSLAFVETKIKELVLPSTVNEIYNDAFYGMKELTKISLYKSNLTADSIDYINSLKGIEIVYL